MRSPRSANTELRERPGPFYVESEWTEEADGGKGGEERASPAAASKVVQGFAQLEEHERHQ